MFIVRSSLTTLTMLLITLLLSLMTVSFANASPLGKLEQRSAASTCTAAAVQLVDAVLSLFPTPAHSICSQILSRTAPATSTISSTTVVRASTTLSGSTTVTVTSGESTATTTVTTTVTSTATSVDTILTTETDLTSATVTTVDTTTTVSSGTTTTTQTITGIYKRTLEARATASNIGQAFPGAPAALSSVLLNLASTACNCYLGPVVTPLTTLLHTTTTTTQINDISSTSVTVPSDTTTLVSSVTSTAVIDTTISTTVTATTTTTASVTATSVVTQTVLQTTTTAQATVTATCASAAPTFAVQVIGGAYNGEYLYSAPFVNQNADLASASGSITPQSVYTLTGTVLSEYNGDTLTEPAGLAFGYVEFRTIDASAAGGEVPAVCSIANNQLTCVAGSANQFGICNISGPVLVLTRSGYYPSGYGCTNVVLSVIPLCISPS
ncbi:hypothetical protein BAUCODRAFT_465319 [Baudoinia panamericana UAMH 10762]|uniref:Uncharacterized protein n=1 Tax=Baudoinia panamericana (strain UAMH 10762) TaxID=717646 RepID=M2MX93_BAUPA|nr:uncharacterized protein BAUCODRAFT_465319 [Baudoinia panamericana UAMH 10762]EMC96173.1 hypothetical protein BAUCODRAFT_465319 [Baudoinia panamericana UAMH 10762]